MYMNVHIDDDEAAGELSDKMLMAEVKRRNLKDGAELDISDKEKIFHLRCAALELRKHDKLSHAVWLEDIASDME